VDGSSYAVSQAVGASEGSYQGAALAAPQSSKEERGLSPEVIFHNIAVAEASGASSNLAALPLESARSAQPA